MSSNTPETASRLRGLGLLALALLALGSLYVEGTGWLGGFLRRVLRALFGAAAPWPPALAAVHGLQLLLGRPATQVRLRGWGLVLAGLVAAVAAQLALPAPAGGLVDTARAALANGPYGHGGGLVGGSLTWVLQALVGPVGLRAALALGGLTALGLLVDRSLVARLAGLADRLRAGVGAAVQALVAFVTVPEAEAPPAAAPAPEAAPASEAVAEQPAPAPVPAAGAREPRLRRASTESSAPAAGAGGDAGAQREPVPEAAAPGDGPGYRLPPLTLLPRGAAARRGPRDSEQQARDLEQTLASFGVQARVVGVQQGPAVTRFELEPAAGVKVSRIQSLASDIALRLAAPDVRIEAPIPGKRAVGIEVPNREIAPVQLRDVLETPAFQESPSLLTVAFGMDITGQPVVASLERLLHVLIAGATGSGKSVCLNALITSLLFKALPDQVKLVLIDPKMVELSVYNGIPHLLAPVVTEPKRAASVLRWLVREMERRYERFAEAGVRDVHRFNAAAREQGEEPLPLIVVVIDELADLMMVAPVEVEDAIQRLAQMARAAGIHLVVATQRPSVDVITGVIKANIPSRVAFAVSSQTDSRVILDLPGAEKLVGKGDMLFHPLGATKPVRVQGAYIGERELETVLDFVRRQGEPSYREEVLAAAEAEDAEEADAEDDELFAEALRIVIETGQASVSLLQRRLRVGYTRAGRLIDMMEARGFVGPHQGSKARDVRIGMEEYRRLFGGR